MNSDHGIVVTSALEKHEGVQGALLPILHEIQDTLGYIPISAIELIAKGINRSRAEVHGVVSFYHHFRTEKPGKNILQICRSEACQSMGAADVINQVSESLNIDFHETTTDGKITVEPIYCLGHCACAPAIMVNGDPVAKVTREKIKRIIDELGENS